MNIKTLVSAIFTYTSIYFIILDNMKNIIAFLLIAFTLIGCKSQEEKDREIIEDFIANEGWSAEELPSGLFVVIDNQGTGEFPTADSTVKVFYKGYLPNKKIFDQALNSPAEFKIAHTIIGWQEGIPKFKEGGEGHLLIPSHLGYGKFGTGSIPGNSVLIFDVGLLEITGN